MSVKTAVKKKIPPKTKQEINQRGRRFFRNIKKGRGVSSDFFRRHGWLIIFFTVVILVLIGIRYRTRVYMSEIKTLRQELKHAQNKCIEEKALFMSLIREHDMVELAREHNLGLGFPVQPPYQLTEDAVDSVAEEVPVESRISK